MDKICHVCMQEVGTAHKCRNCHNNIHIFCGIKIGEEGYGQEVICSNCSKKKGRLHSINVPNTQGRREGSIAGGV